MLSTTCLLSAIFVLWKVDRVLASLLVVEALLTKKL